MQAPPCRFGGTPAPGRGRGAAWLDVIPSSQPAPRRRIPRIMCSASSQNVQTLILTTGLMLAATGLLLYMIWRRLLPPSGALGALLIFVAHTRWPTIPWPNYYGTFFSTAAAWFLVRYLEEPAAAQEAPAEPREGDLSWKDVVGGEGEAKQAAR